MSKFKELEEIKNDFEFYKDNLSNKNYCFIYSKSTNKQLTSLKNKTKLNNLVIFEIKFEESFYPHALGIKPYKMNIEELINKIKRNTLEIKDYQLSLTRGLKREALKKSQGQKKPEELIRYLGDYFIWAEIIKDVLSEEKNALFITSDLKEDWWEMPKKMYDLRSYEPRKELIEEFVELTGKRIEFIPFDLFISFLESYNNQESLRNYLFQNIAEIESIVSDQILEYVGENKRLIISDNDIIWDSDITKGYVPYEYNVEVLDTEIISVEIDSSDEGEDGELSVELIVSVNIWGIFDVFAGLEDVVYRSVNGDFTVEDIRIQVEIDFSSSQVNNVKDIMIKDCSDDFNLIIQEAEVVNIELIDSGSIDLDYDDPDESALLDYYQWEWDRDEDRFVKW